MNHDHEENRIGTRHRRVARISRHCVRHAEFSYMPGGRVYGEIGSDTGNGSWRITDDGRYCHEWSNFFDATENCYQWYDVGGGRYRMVSADSYRRWNIEVWRIRPGLD